MLESVLVARRLAVAVLLLALLPGVPQGPPITVAIPASGAVLEPSAPRPLLVVPTTTPAPSRATEKPRPASRSRTYYTPKVVETNGYPTEAQWARLRFCENGGRYTSDPGDRYRGAYQFDFSTWSSVGGSGDPADAPAAEQDARAKRLYQQRGWRPWPVCGRNLR